MRLRAIELGQVRKFTGVVAVGDLADGVNLVIGANEAGKSTLLGALRAALFARHSSRAVEVRGLRHHRNETAPRVTVTFEDDEGRWRLEKRFLQAAYARLTGPTGIVMEGDAAEAALRRRLGGGTEAPTGLWSLLLVGQGEALETRVPRDARATLQASLEAALGSAGTGASAGALIARLDERLGELVHGGHGAPIRRWRSIRDDLEEVTAAIAELRRRLDDNAADLDALDDALRARDALVRGFDEEAAEVAVAALDQRLRGEVARREAEAAVEAAEQALARRRTLIGTLGEAEALVAAAEAATVDAEATLKTLEAEGRTARGAFDAAKAELAAADGRLAALRDLEAALDERDRLTGLLAAEAGELSLDLTPAGLATLRLDGARLPAARLRVRVIDPIAVDLGGYGRLELRPAPDRIGRIRAALQRVDARLRDGLRTAWPDGNAADLDRAELERRRDLLEQARGAAEDAVETARQRLADSRAAWQAQHSLLEERRAASLAAIATRGGLTGDLQAARVEVPDEVLEQAAAARRDALTAASRRPGGEGPTTDDGLREALAAHRSRRHELEREIERRRASIDVRAADGLRERLVALEEKQAHLAREDAALAREVEVVRLLRATLVDAEAAVRDRYLEPLLRRLRPLLDLLLPGLQVEVDEKLQVVAVRRDGVREPLPQLSHGTREQIAIAVRLAFAEVLVDDGQPCFVVLDDALVFSDDDRLERMFRVLELAGRRVQVLILTCRERAFAGLRGERLRIVPVASDEAAPQPAAASRLA